MWKLLVCMLGAGHSTFCPHLYTTIIDVIVFSFQVELGTKVQPPSASTRLDMTAIPRST